MREASFAQCMRSVVQTVLLGRVTDLLLTVAHLLALFRQLTCDVLIWLKVKNPQRPKNIRVIPIVMHGVCVSNHDGCYWCHSTHCVPSE